MVKPIPNRWDGIAFVLVLGIIALFAWGAKQMTTPYHLGQPLPISLDPKALPEYASLTVMRMIIAMLFSLLFTFIFSTWAAKSKRAGQIIIPCIDILQSVPVLGFLTLTAVGFIALFPNSRLGPECAVIFVIFTAQVWNMSLSFYQSLCTVPQELKEAADMFHLSAWQRFWRIEVPFAMPGLLWNMMLSMSGSWIFLVASESITIANQNISLPGIGSYLGLAITQANGMAVAYAVIAMFIVILLYDQLFFRPLLSWSEKFNAEYVAQEKTGRPWITVLLQRTHVLKYLSQIFSFLGDTIVNTRIFRQRIHETYKAPHPTITRSLTVAWYFLVFCIVVYIVLALSKQILMSIKHDELIHVFLLGSFTAARVFVVVLISTIIWVPIGVWIGLNRRAAEIIQPIAQFLAAFPMNVLFPVIVILILKYKLDVEIWTTPLMLLGTQWYILFNVIAGTSALPKDLKQVADNFNVSGWQWWKRLILPGIFPYYITGTITAVGNSWNTSVIAEVVSWGSTTLTATGLGAYITEYSNKGDFSRVALGMVVMSMFVLVMNRLLWRPLYNLAQSRYRLD